MNTQIEEAIHAYLYLKPLNVEDSFKRRKGKEKIKRNVHGLTFINCSIESTPNHDQRGEREKKCQRRVGTGEGY